MKSCPLLCCSPFQLIFIVPAFSLHVSKTDLSNASVFHFRFKVPVLRCCLLTSYKEDNLAFSVHLCRHCGLNASLPAVYSWWCNVLWLHSLHFMLGVFPAVRSVSLTRLLRAAHSLRAPPVRFLRGHHHSGFQFLLLEPAHPLLSAPSHPCSPWDVRASDPRSSVPLPLQTSWLLIPCAVLSWFTPSC